MPCYYWQSTGRSNQTLVAPPFGRRVIGRNERNLRRRRGRRLAASIRQFCEDEIDDEEFCEEIELAHVNAASVNGHLGALIADYFHVCDDCGDLDRQEDCIADGDRLICESCQESYYCCEYCDSLTHCDSVTWINDAAICEHCRDDHYYYWESDDEWHAEPESSEGLIREYNVTLTGPIGALPIDRRREHVLGAELELEVDNPEEFAEAIREAHALHECHCKHDGSLSHEHGVEVVTGHGTLAKLMAVLESVTTIARAHGGRSHDGDGCGLHVGLDRSQFSVALQARIIVFWNHRANYPFLRQFTRRDYRNNSYCQVKAEKASRDFLNDPNLASGDKYEAVNTRHRSHLEFRAFRGSLVPRTLRACLSLVSLIASFCDQANPEPDDLTSQAFVKWLQTIDDDCKAAIIAYLEHRGKRLADFAPCV
jgi:hypothetical protein